MAWCAVTLGASAVGFPTTSSSSLFCSSNSQFKIAKFQRLHQNNSPRRTNPWPETLNFPVSPRQRQRQRQRQLCRAAAEYQFPDPIPEFAQAETDKFRSHLLKKLGKKADLFGDSLQEVVGVCTEIFSTFMHAEYGGPGTLLVIPFIDMADTLEERGLPGGPQASRAAVKWAQDHVDKDWKEWTQGSN